MRTDRSTRRRFRVAKNERRKIATEQMRKLCDIAIRQHNTDPILAQKQSAIAWTLSTKMNARLGKMRLLFCHTCKEFIVPPSEARYRLSKKRRSINITCLKCGSIYRRVF